MKFSVRFGFVRGYLSSSRVDFDLAIHEFLLFNLLKTSGRKKRINYNEIKGRAMSNPARSRLTNVNQPNRVELKRKKYSSFSL